MFTMAIAPSMAFIYPDGSEDNKFEIFGPRIDKILVKKYNEVDPMFAALQAGEVDITDWALTKTWQTTFSGDSDIVVKSYGGEAGYYIIDYNHNSNPYLGNPPNPEYPNPINPNPTSVAAFRAASTHLVDRVYLCNVLGEGLYDPIFTPIPGYMAFWVDPEIKPGGAKEELMHPYSVDEAAATFTAGGFPIGPDGYRYWDINGNGVKDTGEAINIKIYSRADKLRKGSIDLLTAGYDNPKIKIPYTRQEVSGGDGWQICMVEKNYNMYTGGWIFIGPDPDYLYDLYSFDNYYHPEDPPNYAGMNDPQINELSKLIKNAPDEATALSATLLFQERFCEISAETPLGSTAGAKAYSKYYTGGNNGASLGDAEDKYRGKAWTHVVNEKGQGENSFYTPWNAYPEGYYFGDGNMVMRYGWKDPTMPVTLHPMYSSWYWESETWGKIFDSLGGRDPMTKGPFQTPFLAANWTSGEWVDNNGTTTTADDVVKGSVRVQIRPDVKWHDGTPFTIDDVIYTFIELPKALLAKECPDVWWQPTIDQISNFYRIDDYTCEILMKVKSTWATGWVIGNVIVPKHKWAPFIATHEAADISGTMWPNHPDMLTGTGAFKMVSDSPSTLLMERVTDFYQTAPVFVGKVVNNLNPEAGIQLTAADYTGTTAPTAPFIFTPYKVKPGTAAKTVGVTIKTSLTNLAWGINQDGTMKVEVLKGTTVIYTDERQWNLGGGATDSKSHAGTSLVVGPGKYTVKVTVTITSGALYDFAQTMDASLRPRYMGPITYGQDFKVTVPEDINEDIQVNILDISKAAAAFGAKIGDLRWQPSADLDRNYVVNILDLSKIARMFGFKA
jgi:ABC-type transport system substrate-binding protein